MLNPRSYLSMLINSGVTFFAGVPDSILREICSCVSENVAPEDHVIAANEGAAIGLGIGHHLGTGQIPLIYLQNSGLGNIVNPLLSLASSEVYGVPMLLLIGWRGAPDQKDEPQHVHQGRVMLPMLDAMNVPAIILSKEPAKADQQTKAALQQARKLKGPVALVVSKDTFEKYQIKYESATSLTMTREQAIVIATGQIEDSAAVVCTTGMASRELFEFRANTNLGHQKDFLTVGGMGHANQIALGLALACPNRSIYCFDGDGAALMHMGSLPIIGQSNRVNLTHLIFNNGAHGSVGGQPTVGLSINIPQIAASCGYASAERVETEEELINAISKAQENKGPNLIEVRVKSGERKNIGRPTIKPEENKLAFMDFLRG